LGGEDGGPVATVWEERMRGKKELKRMEPMFTVARSA
jgi:hypothetical protein